MQSISISVHERKDRPGRWRVFIRGPGGRRCTTFGSEAEARQWAADIRTVAPADGHHTVAQAAEGYLTACETRGLRPVTLRGYRDVLGQLIALAGASLDVQDLATDSATARVLDARRQTVGQASLRQSCFHLRQLFAWARAQGWIERVPDIVVPPAPEPRQEWLRSHEVEPYLEACTITFRPLAEAAIYCGLRRAEACVTQCSDFDLAARVLWVRPKPELDWLPKGGRARGIPLVGRGLDIAREMATRPPWEWAWPGRGGHRRLTCSWFAKAAHRTAERAGITRSITYHDLRRTFGALLIEAGAPLRAVQAALGHSRITTTERVYAPITQQWVEQHMQSMAELLDVRAAEHRRQNPAPPPRRVLEAVR